MLSFGNLQTNQLLFLVFIDRAQSATMEKVNCKKPHVLAVPFPAQGHVRPLMKLCRHIAKHGIKVTFVNIESIHQKIVASATKEEKNVDHNFELVSVPDGRRDGDEQIDVFRMGLILRATMPKSLTDLIERINISCPNSKISCVIADITVGWILETTHSFGVESLLFSLLSAAAFSLMFHIPKLLEEGFLDLNGSVKKGEKITLSDDIPAWSKDELSWSFSSDIEAEKLFFECAKTVSEITKRIEWVLSNTFYNLESFACDFIPNLLAIGPLLETNVSKFSCNIHQQDMSCLSWLDSKTPRSVVYVSFGSLAVFSQRQLDELAMGLELSGRSFLWVVRSNRANGKRAVYPDGFLERVGELGKIVKWAPQEKVLSHPSLACFLSHCGWNSTLEGLSNGVPFLCWPYFGDQFHNQNYICDKWEIGLRIDCDENGIRLSHEIKKKIDVLFSDDSLKTNALKLKEMSAKSIREGGDSYKSFQKFMDHLRN